MEIILIASAGISGVAGLCISCYLFGYLRGARIFDSTVNKPLYKGEKKIELTEGRVEPPKKKPDPWSEGFANIMSYTGEEEGGGPVDER